MIAFVEKTFVEKCLGGERGISLMLWGLFFKLWIFVWWNVFPGKSQTPRPPTPRDLMIRPSWASLWGWKNIPTLAPQDLFAQGGHKMKWGLCFPSVFPLLFFLDLEVCHNSVVSNTCGQSFRKMPAHTCGADDNERERGSLDSWLICVKHSEGPLCPAWWWHRPGGKPALSWPWQGSLTPLLP